MKPVLIIRTGRAPDNIRGRHGDFPHWFRICARLLPEQLQIVDVAAGESLPPPQDVAGAMITGSAAMVTERAAWSERTAGWIRNAMDVELPLFGVCYGHQLMAHALGGGVDYLSGGREIGTQPIELLHDAASDPMANTLPASFRAHTTHEQSVLEPPRGSIVLARSARDPHQLLRHGPHAISTQFHPEFNAEVMRAYIKRKHADMQRDGMDPHQTFSAVAATPVARRLLQQFAHRHGWINRAAWG
jgi:GMP synthase (glutamine-hydrolysing)